ncbi:MAG: hypothetical protein Kow00122_15030 [Thermoleophilia bacterium]
MDLLGRLLDQVTSAILAADGHGTVIVFNTEAQATLGADAESVLGQSLQRLTTDDPNPLVRTLTGILWDSLQRGRPRRRQTVVVEDEGRTWILGYTVTPLLTEAGVPEGVIATFADLTEVRSKEREQAEIERFAHVGRVASWMAHEVKNPLATIQMYAQLCGRKGGPDVQESVKVIRDQVSLAQSRISEILRTISLRPLEPRKLAVTDLQRLLREYCSREVPGLPHVKLELTVGDGSYHTPLSDNDAVSLISNLVTNAAEAVEGPGHVWISLTQDGRCMSLVIEDDGPGFPDEEPHRLFQPFFTSKPRGTGLGLWVVKRIAESVGGSVLLQNTEQGGARVTIELPRLSLADLEGRTVLVVEDEPALRRVLCRELESFGALTRQASGGDEALALLETGVVDLLVTDVNMPCGGGGDLVRRSRRDLPTVMISGVSGAETEYADLQRPGLAFLLKPFEPEDLGLALSYVQWEVGHATGRRRRE